MNTFNWLLIGHLVGDWVLQSDWMARGKRQALFTLAGAVHFTVYTVSVMFSLWLSGVQATMGIYLWLASLIFVFHWLIDATNMIERWMRLYGQSGQTVRLMIDQTLHLVVLALVSAFLPY